MPSPNSPSNRRRTERVFGTEAPSAQAAPQALSPPADGHPVGSPPPEGRPIRFVREIGIRAKLRIYWDRVKVREDGAYLYQNDCPNSYGNGHAGTHNAYAPLPHQGGATWESFGKVEDYSADRWPTACSHCGRGVPPEFWTRSCQEPSDVGKEGVWLVRQVFESRLYDSPSGDPEPLDVFWRECGGNREGSGKCWEWDNCPGQHLIAICPNGHDWCIDGRASNCGSPDDRTHRCWVRHGSPEDGTLHVDKDGHTCNAGGGSIQAGDYHGHLHQGRFIP